MLYCAANDHGWQYHVDLWSGCFLSIHKNSKSLRLKNQNKIQYFVLIIYCSFPVITKKSETLNLTRETHSRIKLLQSVGLSNTSCLSNNFGLQFFFLRANLKDELLIFRYKIILFNISGCWIYAVKVEKIRKNIFVFISQITNVVWFTFFACFVLFLVLFFFRLITQYSKIMRFI